MLRIDSSLPPRRYFPLEGIYRNHALQLRASNIVQEVDDQRKKYEMQWVIPDSIKASAAASIAKNEAGISSMIAGVRKAELASLLRPAA